VYRHGKQYRQAVKVDGKLTWVVLDVPRVIQALSGEQPTPHRLREFGFTKGSISEMVQRAKRQAKARGIAFDLSELDLATLIARSGGKCEVSGVDFDWMMTAGKRGLRPFAASIDRIDSNGIYTLANCRLVCLAVNIALSDWGDNVLRKIARGMVVLEAQESTFRKLTAEAPRKNPRPIAKNSDRR
jgi:hypothetical protein